MDRESGPRAIPLAGASRVDPAAMAWYGEASRDPRAGLPIDARRRYSQRARELADLIWSPVQHALENASQVWVVAEEPLRRVNLAALTAGDDGFILETGPAVHSLESEITLLSPPRGGQGNGILALGGPDFGVADCGPGTAFSPLPGARAEVLALQGLWGGEPALSLTGSLARERAFHRLAPGRRVLHIASHAFTMGTPPVDAPHGLGSTGLALGGANSACRERADDDGLLTGSEIARMDLSGVEWAVLSGCETGLWPGGLGSAFQEAGVRRVIGTL
jgi:CHAT domain-containing protein